MSGLIQPSKYPEIVFELKPNLNTYHKKARFITNAQGLRDKDYGISKSDQSFRVAVIGDSLTMAAGVPVEKAYHSLLEERFGRDYPEKEIEFINFEVGGYNLRQYAAVIQYKALAYYPDLILIGFCAVNDFSESKKYKSFLRAAKPYQVKLVGWPFFESRFILEVQRILNRHPRQFFLTKPRKKSMQRIKLMLTRCFRKFSRRFNRIIFERLLLRRMPFV